MRVLIALACLLALAGAASIGGIKPKVSRELERTGPNPIVQKTDADVNTVDNNVYQIADKDAPAASNEANNDIGSGSNRAWPGAPVYRRKFISSNGPRPDPKLIQIFVEPTKAMLTIQMILIVLALSACITSKILTVALVVEDLGFVEDIVTLVLIVTYLGAEVDMVDIIMVENKNYDLKFY
ncbi:uncharacterized protein LOC130691295 isoform X2 [Daphnia carinata]|uniref:uncharacterized protein LOC130691295 isoform X2 n=1 Tax=Daphnia carinata TaxID=120202 RepID=UPI002580E9B2|nr:uncharacterized protein LOC130691295 isoform X2 [Daphnia carinata]